MSTALNRPTGIWWASFSIAACLPWLIPLHSEPWTTFYSEMAAGLAGVVLGVGIVFASPRRWSIDTLAIGFATAALIPLLQAELGLFLFPAEAPVVSLYLFGFALAVATARQCESVAPGRLDDALFAALAIAALASTGLALAQWMGVNWGLFAVSAPPGSRAIANLGQPNQLSTLLVWGLIALWWAHLHRRIGSTVAVFAAAFVLLGIASTQSRTGWLAVALLVGSSQIAPKRLGTATQRAAFLGLGLWFVVLVLAWGAVTQSAGQLEAVTLDARMTAGNRPAVWTMMIDGILQRPWTGYGWNQGRLVQVALLPKYANPLEIVQHAHNLVLDLMVWNGVPLGLGLFALLGLWFCWQLRRATTASQHLLLLALGALLLHAMLELPHCNAYFLIPAALMMGTLNARGGLTAVAHLPRTVAAAAVVMVGAALIAMCVDYQRIEADWLAYRMRAARIGTLGAPSPPRIFVLSALQSALISFRTEPGPGLDPHELDHLRIALERYPIESGLFRFASAAALNNQTPSALIALNRLCDLYGVQRCAAAREGWRDFARQHAEVLLPPFPPRP